MASLAALFAALLSTFFSAFKDLVSKQLASRLDGTTSTFASFAFALPFYAIALALLTLAGQNAYVVSLLFFQLVLLRAFTDAFAEGMKMYALAHGDISLVASFMSLSPLFLIFLAPLVTGDSTSLLGIIAVIVVVGGSLLIVYHPTATGWREQRVGILLGVGASLFFTLNTLFDTLAARTGAKETTDFAAAVFSGFAVTLAAAFFVAPFALRRSFWSSVRACQRPLWLRGFMEVVFMVSKLYAVQYLNPAYVTSIQRLALVISIVGGRVLFKEADFGRRLAAGVLITLGVIGIVLLQAWEKGLLAGDPS
jgi:drug/metabolite transporter (DMT)-like permease